MFFSRKEKGASLDDISTLSISTQEDIFIIGNGPSLLDIDHKKLDNSFTIGTNRSWLWRKTNILMWRDSRITEELQFFGVSKEETLWCAGEPAFNTSDITLSHETQSKVDFRFTDSWKDQYLGKGMKWNGIVFHALALAKHINPQATIHLLGIDLSASGDYHHFFNAYKGFDQGFYKSNWEPEQFNYQKRLDMMVQNFSRLKSRGFEIVNHSPKSPLTELFGYQEL